jgi:hypothetical protein
MSLDLRPAWLQCLIAMFSNYSHPLYSLPYCIAVWNVHLQYIMILTTILGSFPTKKNYFVESIYRFCNLGDIKN